MFANNLFPFGIINKMLPGETSDRNMGKPNWHEQELTYEFIRGLVVGEGSFTFSPRTRRLASGEVLREKIPAFAIAMHERDQWLLRQVRNKLGLPNSVYVYGYPSKDGYNRGKRALLIVRELDSLKSIIIPFFYNSLFGHKAVQFNEWLEIIGNDPAVPDSYKLFYRLHKGGFYEKELALGGQFAKFLS